MPDFDVAVIVGEKNMNSVVHELFSRRATVANLFSGQSSTTIEGLQISFSWKILSPPVFRLAPPSEQLWGQAITAGGETVSPHENACVVSLPDFSFSVTASGNAPTQSTLSLCMICSIAVADQTMKIVPAGICVDLSSVGSFDQILYRSVLVPQLLAQAGVFLGSQAIPKIDMAGMSLGAPTLLVEDGRAVAAAFLSGKPGSPDREALRTVPGGDFHVLLSRDALRGVVRNGVQSLRGRTEATDGHAGFGIGQANYSASIRLDSLDAEILTATTLRVQAGVTVQASAGVDVLPGVFDQIGQGVTQAANAVANAFKSY